MTVERTYPNLSDADVSLIPKTVNENGRTLTLSDVSWQDAATDPTDGYDIPIRYTAVASYTGTATSKYSTGYTVTADYKGDVTRTSCDTVVYTAVFSSIGMPGILKIVADGLEMSLKKKIKKGHLHDWKIPRILIYVTI